MKDISCKDCALCVKEQAFCRITGRQIILDSKRNCKLFTKQPLPQTKQFIEDDAEQRITDKRYA